MHIVTLAVVILSTYSTAIQNLHFVSITDFSEFLCKVGTRQKRKIGTFSLCFLLVGCCTSSSSHVHILTKCALRLLTGDISIEKIEYFPSCKPSAVFLTILCEAEETSVVKSTTAQVA